tara:strand:- start:358 stop:3600 length:3243 start_codon:yes stop_codon:yes gene_type:complete
MSTTVTAVYSKGVILDDQGSAPSDEGSGTTIFYSKGGALYYKANGGSETAVGGSVNIDGYDALGGTGLHQTQDHFLFSDNGTEKKITFSNLEDAIFGNVSGDATIAAGGAVTLAAAQTNVTSLLATDIKIGEDDQTKIDFETEDEIHFYAANAEQVYLADGVFGPQTDSDVDLGTNSVRWKNAYVDSVTSTGNILCSGEVQTANIGYTDGDNAITIADGGGITAAAGITSTAAANTLGATSFNDADITNVGDIALDSISADGTGINISIPDNQATALTIKEGSNTYMAFASSNGSEYIAIGKELSAPDNVAITAGNVGDMQFYHDGSNSYITNSTGALKLATETSGIAVTIGHSTSEVTVADNLTVAGDLTVQGTTTTVNVEVVQSANGVIFEGSSADAHETTLIAEDPTADHTYHLPDLGDTADEGWVLAFDTNPGTSPLITATTSELNLLDGGTSVGSSITVANTDGFIVNDAGTMKSIPASDIRTYCAPSAGELNIATFDIDGGTDIGEALADADLFIVDNGAGGTNRKCTAARLKTYIGSNIALDDLAAGDAAVNLTTTAGNITIDAQGNDTDIIFKGTDGSSDTTFLTLDGSDAGTAIFNHDIHLDSDGAIIAFGDDQELTLTHVHNVGLVMECNGLTEKPVFTVKNTNADANGATIKLTKDGSSVADDDVCGNLVFASEDDGGGAHTYASIVGSIKDATAGEEGGLLELKVASHDGTVTTGIELEDGNASGEVDVKIGAGTSSVTTINGTLDLGDRNITNVGQISLDTVAADGSTIAISLTDNTTSALAIGESSNGYMSFNTNNSSEYIGIGQNVIMDAASFTFDDSANDDSSHELVFYKAKGSGGACADGTNLGKVSFAGRNAAGNGNLEFASILGEVDDVSDGDGRLTFSVLVGGSDSETMVFDEDGLTLENNSGYGKVTAHSFVTYSDENLKMNIEPMHDALSTVKKLQGVTYDWKNTGENDIGFIAQDVQEVVPEVVKQTHASEDVYAMDYARLTALLVEGMKEQQNQIEYLQDVVSKLSGDKNVKVKPYKAKVVPKKYTKKLDPQELMSGTSSKAESILASKYGWSEED